MKRRSFLKLSCLTVAALAINPLSAINSIQEIGLKKTVSNSYEVAKRLALEQHAIEMEKAFLFGRWK